MIKVRDVLLPSDGQHLVAVEGLTGKPVLRLAEEDQPPWSRWWLDGVRLRPRRAVRIGGRKKLKKGPQKYKKSNKKIKKN